ncbi:hypothetical protein HPB52_001112 [Rhipicephalus sanguineus]|uniref:Uncharacterized protein n=1 Tax=Rhipicephalus sanguineus TaxID=34632 RepID=A0A9D4QGD8_RHISA|nr:hypothetical protein HPB52_001112 [Rhipicephalus sanguineus]
MAESSERLFRRERKRRVDASVQLASMNNDLAQPACHIQSPTESLPDTNSSGRALHQVEGTRQNEQTRRRHSSDVQSADYDHVSGVITSDDEESNVNFRQRLQAWAVESRCSHAADTLANSR